MVPGADQQQRKLARLNQMDGPQFKVKKDPRRTRVGRFLTATNLDLAVEIARIPEHIKGFGHVKERNVAAARAKWTKLEEEFSAKPLLQAASDRVE